MDEIEYEIDAVATTAFISVLNSVYTNIHKKDLLVPSTGCPLYRVSQKKVPSIEIRPFVVNFRCDTSGNLL